MEQDPRSAVGRRPSPAEALRRALAAARRPPPQAASLAPDDPPRRTAGSHRTINATGRPFARGATPLPLPDAAIEAIARSCRGEPTPGPGALCDAIAAATGAGAALVLADLPDAIILTLGALAGPKGDVVVARGELLETDDGLRVEALIRASGARLREAGAANAVTAEDLRAATTPATRVLMTVEPRTPGSRDGAPPSLAETARIARLQGAVAVHVSAGGSLADDALAPSVATLLRQGADVVLAPCDRLLQGPRSAVAAGSRDAMAPILRLAAAIRPPPDRMTLAALEATLALHAAGADAGRQMPLSRLLEQDRLLLEERARRLAGLLGDPAGLDPRVVTSRTALGGGIDLATFESRAVTLACPGGICHVLLAFLVEAEPAVLCRAEADRLVFDVFTLRDDELASLATAIRAAMSAAIAT